MHKKTAIILMLVVMAVGIGAGYGQMRPPAPPAESNEQYPAYQRMLANLKAMTAAPHPSGSKELEAVRAHLLAQIREMGLEANVDAGFYSSADREAENRDKVAHPRKGGSAVSAPPPEVIEEEGKDLVLHNVWVKLDAPGTDQGVLMLAHYDSKKRTPGAADDMVSVSALLEAMRKQAGRTDLRNDLYFLFTDGEEESALGAKAFVKSHPELQDKIDLVLNFDARGNRGGLLMFETSAPNDELMQHFRSARSRPLAFSFVTALYRRMPNGTDLTTFLDAGYPGLNFAIAEGVEHYHQPTDNYENMNRGTAYDYLRTVLEMADYSGRTNLQNGDSAGNSVFFTFFPGQLVLMSDILASVLSAIAALAAMGWLGFQIKRGGVRVREILIGTGWLVGTVVAAGLLGWGISSLLARTTGLGETTNNDGAFAGTFVVMGLAVLATAIYRMRRQSLAKAIAELLPLQVLLIAGTTLFYVEISYLFTFPLLGMLGVAMLDRYRVGRMIASSVFGVGLWLLYVPLCWLVYVMFMLQATPVSVALGVLPISMLAACFAAKYD